MAAAAGNAAVTPPGYPARDMEEGKIKDDGGGKGIGGGFVNMQSTFLKNTTVSEEEQMALEMKFEEKTVRRGFLRKVYSILSVQLSFTVGAIAFFIFYIPTNYYGGSRHFIMENMWLLWTSMAVSIVILFPMVCVKTLRMTFPMNFILLAVFTMAESVMLGMVSMLYDTEAVIIAAGITAVIVFALTVFAFQTKWDFTMCGGMLLCVLMVFLVFGIVMIFIPQTKYLQMIYGALGALIFSLYLVYDTQMMMGGDHKFSISPEEYIFAALALYLDIINIFLYILRFVGAARSS